MISTRTQALLIFFLGLILFTVELGPQEIMGFESRFYLFALEVWRHGPDWFPTTYHRPYPDYPGTATFLIYAFSKLIGKLNRFTAVFPSAAASALTLAITYLIGALHSRRLGLSAVLMLLFTLTFAEEARSISLDQFVTAVTVLCFYLVYSAQELKKPYRVAWIFPLFVLGFAFRGPLGLVIPTGVVCLFYLTAKKYPRFFCRGCDCDGITYLVCCVAIIASPKSRWKRFSARCHIDGVSWAYSRCANTCTFFLF